MYHLYEIDPKFYPALLAGEMSRSFAGFPAAGTIPADASRRTILIGLGGMGVMTIDRIKGVLQERFQPGWEAYTSFLAIDADQLDLEDAKYLTGSEGVCTTRPGIQTAVNIGLPAYPKAWHPFVSEEEARYLVSFNSNGSGRRRLMGRMKLHYKSSGSRGVDEEIVAKLAEQKNNVLMPFSPQDQSSYEVYVIGSLCGGTCSGSFLDMPALIRRALQSDDRTNIHAMLYLPDILTAMDFERTWDFEANSYAALKELNYYQGLTAREGYREAWPYSRAGEPELHLDAQTGLFQSVRLLGANPAAGRNALDQAVQAVQNHILDTLTHYPVNPFPPAPAAPAGLAGEHGFLRHYTAIGNARASLPRDLLRAYEIGSLFRLPGLSFFCEEDRFEDAQTVDADAAALLRPLMDLLHRCQAPAFSYEATFGHKPTCEDICNGTADNHAVHFHTEQIIFQMTSSEEERRLREQVQACFRQFRVDVRQYVEQKGPMAFANLFEGHCLRDDNGRHARGIREWLCLLRDDLDPATCYPNQRTPAAKADQELQHVTQYIQERSNSLFGRLHMRLGTGPSADLAARWLAAYDCLANARIHEIRRKMLLGPNGILCRFFLEPASQLAWELYTFGKTVKAMSDIYAHHGAQLEDFLTFQSCTNEVNPGALFPCLHEQLLRRIDAIVQRHAPQAIRHALVESFFRDPESWLIGDEDSIERRGGGQRISLRRPDAPVPARRAFDRCIDGTIVPVPPFYIRELFHMAQGQGITEARFAQELMQALSLRSAMLLQADLPGPSMVELVYPAEIHNWEPTLAAALCNEAQARFPNITFRISHDDHSVSLHRMSVPFEIFRLWELSRWEQAYEATLHCSGAGLHGYSPDIVMTRDEQGISRCQEQTPWADYPGITFRQDPTAPDPETGRISREGQFMLQIDRLLADAHKAGVLYAEDSRSGWHIRRVHLSNAFTWAFDLDQLSRDPDTRLYPEDHALLLQILHQNQRTLTDVSRNVTPHPHGTEEAAWHDARRVLWFHRPMLSEIRDTMQRIKPWYEEVCPPPRSGQLR